MNKKVTQFPLADANGNAVTYSDNTGNLQALQRDRLSAALWGSDARNGMYIARPYRGAAEETRAVRLRGP